MIRDPEFEERARRADGMPVTGWARCKCGGRYTLDQDTRGRPRVLHNVPTCARYDAIDTDADAVRFSEENRAAAQTS